MRPLFVFVEFHPIQPLTEKAAFVSRATKAAEKYEGQSAITVCRVWRRRFRYWREHLAPHRLLLEWCFQLRCQDVFPRHRCLDFAARDCPEYIRADTVACYRRYR